MLERRSSWKLMFMPREPTWWIWVVTATLLCAGLAGYPAAFLAVVGLSAAQTLFFLFRERSLKASAVQTRLAYTVLLSICLLPGLRWLYWLPTIGTLALVVCGYCLMARFLFLLPWNRSEKITPGLLWHTFLSAPAFADGRQGAIGESDGGCPGGVCSIEAQVGPRHRPEHAALPIGSTR